MADLAHPRDRVKHMNNSFVNTGRMAWAALRMLFVLTVVTGIFYPLVVTGIGQAAFHSKADGSIVKADGKEVGSKPIGQSWNIKGTDKPDPKWFQPRPSNSGPCSEAVTGLRDMRGSRRLGESRVRRLPLS
jgi:K+-transporting ATPase c subunit